MVKIELPEGWSKSCNEYGKIYYYNQINDEVSSQHPLMKKFRNYYHEILK